MAAGTRLRWVQTTCCLIYTLCAAADPTINMLPIAHGLIIDAGSGGSRMHVYQWEPRLFETLPPPISHPESKNSWTGRFGPGLATYADHPWDVAEHLTPLVEFAKEVLAMHKKDWWKFPIFLKGTGGMRQLSWSKREEILRYVRLFLFSSPFYFEFDFARVISGEEEGIYGWAAINFIKGVLLTDSNGAGTAMSSMTVGSLDMGGASTQISFFRADQDIMSNLFKLQIGGQKHWNVYTHSFLYFGLNSARLRMHQAIIDVGNGLHVTSRHLFALSNALQCAEDENSTACVKPSESHTQQVTLMDESGDIAVVNTHPHDEITRNRARKLEVFMPGSEVDGGAVNGEVSSFDDEANSFSSLFVDWCLPRGANATFVAADGVEYSLQHSIDGSDFEKCYAQALPLLHKSLNSWCDYAHSGECSIAGIYQPALPDGHDTGQFYAFSGYQEAWSLLNLPEETTLQNFQDKSRGVCARDMKALIEYNKEIGSPWKDKDLWTGCFIITYALAVLVDGYGFSLDTSMHFVDEIQGFKVGWALGSMLYEINALPWKYVGKGSVEYDEKQHKLEKMHKLKDKEEKKKAGKRQKIAAKYLLSAVMDPGNTYWWIPFLAAAIAAFTLGFAVRLRSLRRRGWCGSARYQELATSSDAVAIESVDDAMPPL